MLQRLDRQDVLALTVLGLVGVGLPLWLSAAAATIGIPSNDDWVYMRGAASLYRTGTVDLPGHHAAVIGQLVLVQPLLWLSGGDPWAFTAFGLMMALLGIVSAYLLARCFVGMGSAVMVVLLVIVFPGFSRASATFMTDGPAYAMVMLSLLLGTRWLQGRGGRATLVASAVVGLLAVTIREFAIAAPVTILLAAWLRHRPGERVFLASLSGLFILGLMAIFGAAGSASGRASLQELGPQKLMVLLPSGATLAAVLLPAAIVAAGRRMDRLSPRLLIVAAGIAALVAPMPTGPFVGNLWERLGLAGNALLSGAREPVIGAAMWILSEQIAVFATFLAAALVLRWGQRVVGQTYSMAAVKPRIGRLARSREAPLLLFLAIYGAEVAAFSLMNTPFDRYLFPLIPVAAILLLRGSGPAPRLGRSVALSHAAVAWLAVSALAIGANSFAYDAARWRMGQTVTAFGYDARTVDAGYEWVGLHTTGPGAPDSGGLRTSWYSNVLPSEPPCVIVSNSAIDEAGLTLISVDSSAYRQNLFFGPDQALYVYSVTNRGCPIPPSAMHD